MHRLGFPWFACLGLAALCWTSCTDAFATVLSPVDAGGTAGPRAGSAAGAGGTSGVGAAAGTAGAGGRLRGGLGPRGGEPRAGGEPPPEDDPYCPPATGDNFSRSNEEALLAAVNEAIATGELCLTQWLERDMILACTARRIASPRAPQMPPLGWTFSDFPYESWLWAGQATTAGEALAGLEAQASTHTEDRESLCEAAKHTIYRSAGVAQRGTSWVFLMTE